MNRIRKGLYFSNKYTPRWIIFLIDLGICIFAYVAATFLRHNFDLSSEVGTLLLYTLPLVLLIKTTFFVFMKTYAGIVRYTGTQDAIRIFTAVTISSLTVWFVSEAYYLINSTSIRPAPLSIIIIDYIITIFLMTSFRIMTKILYFQLRTPSSKRKMVAIYGAGQSGIITKRTLDQDGGSNYKVSMFFDDDDNKNGKSIEGVKIYKFDEKNFKSLLKKHKISELIISIQNISPARKKEIIEESMAQNIKVMNVPPVDKWINGELSFKQLKKVKIEDLIGRDTIELNKVSIAKQLRMKRVLVTGAAGSIGSELVKQIMTFHPEELILFDKAETPLYELENALQELRKSHSFNSLEIVLGDVSNYQRLRKVFADHKPQVVFHAAAYKHVPIMESNPCEAVRTNILGTKNLASLSAEFGVEKFVFVSTDKAVNPTNVMGASKRVAEIYVQSLNDKLSYNPLNTKFITTRFGNVLGSNGSVIPRFKKQIDEGGPVTVTHPEITRYFMTISEACQLVLEAGTMGNGGEIYIFDMGQSVKIIDLAKKMIKLSGLKLGKDIQIIYSGLRPGEKIQEELLNDKENTLPTHNRKIMIAQVRKYDFDQVNANVNELIELYDNQDHREIVKKMKDIVPEFLSKNSIYEGLDKPEAILK